MTDKNIYQRIAAVMEKVSYIQKEKKQGMQYNFVSHDSVTARLRPEMLKNGVVCHPVACEHVHSGNRAECAMVVRFVNIDKPEDFFDVPTFGYGVDNQDKGPGKAMSYAVKYALLKTFGLETGDDPETDSIDHKREEPKGPSQAEIDTTISRIEALEDMDALKSYWSGLNRDMKHVASDAAVIAAKDKRRGELS
ncbi:MAG: ERF family protein [Rhizobiales bacterium]|nr:ERF family protein [Hyphomicrobiales bacterium]